jgi:DNA-binding NtrC family response regulator
MVKKILVVDDDEVIVKYLRKIFEDHGYAVCSAAGGVEAMRVLKKEHPDLITLDLEMPEEWGPRFFRKATKLANFEEIPVIVISGLPSRHLAIKNVFAVLGKPFDPDKLIAHVRRAIGEPNKTD